MEVSVHQRRYAQRNRTREPLQVFLRIRPRPSAPGRRKKAKHSGSFTIEVVDGQNIVLHAPHGSQQHRNGGAENRFKFTKVFGETSTQADVYQVASGIVASVLNGQSGLIFAYGTTNSGKTYTIQGGPHEPGIMFRAVERVFQQLAKPRFTVWISYLEIYNDRMFDLLSCIPESNPADRQQLSLVSNKKGEVFENGLREVLIDNIEQAYATINQGQRGRKVAETSFNTDSSRSHCVFTIKLVDANGVMWSKLCIVDLAGAERNSRSKAEVTGIRQREANRINTSLMQLGRCLEALRWNQLHPSRKPRVVPYRDSKITRLFKDFLEGWGRTVMIATACKMGEDFDETFHALKYAALAREIEFIAKVDSGFSSRIEQAVACSLSVQKSCNCNRTIDELMDNVFELKRKLALAERKQEKRLESQEKRLNTMWQQKLESLIHNKQVTSNTLNEIVVDLDHAMDEGYDLNIEGNATHEDAPDPDNVRMSCVDLFKFKRLDGVELFHLNNANVQRYTCAICDKSFKKLNGWRRHVNERKHGKLPHPLLCTNSGRSNITRMFSGNEYLNTYVQEMVYNLQSALEATTSMERPKLFLTRSIVVSTFARMVQAAENASILLVDYDRSVVVDDTKLIPKIIDGAVSHTRYAVLYEMLLHSPHDLRSILLQHSSFAAILAMRRPSTFATWTSRRKKSHRIVVLEIALLKTICDYVIRKKCIYNFEDVFKVSFDAL